MPRLLIHEGDGGVREITLQPGVNRLGRSEENDQPINDPTVSSFHCEIEVGPDGVKVRDLGSTNGTFLDSAPIQEARLNPGQVLHLGAVQLDYPVEAAASEADAVKRPRVRIGGPPPVPDTTVLPAPAPPVVAAVPRGADDCVNHPGVRAEFICQICGKLFCGDCLNWLRTGLRRMPRCPTCGNLCLKVEEHRRQAALKTGTFFSFLPGSFSYPFRKNGMILLLCGTILFSLLDFARSVLERLRVGVFGLAWWITIIMSIGYMFAFMQNIIVSSTNGEENMPGWPEVSNFYEDMFVPFMRLIVIGAMCVAPGVLALVFVSPLVGVPVLFLGLFCMPMALLTVSLADSVAGLNPLIIFSGVAKVLGPYIVTCIVFLVAVSVQGFTQLVLGVVGIPLLPTILGTFVSLYLVTVEMRILGLLYFTNREKLAWFD